MLGRELHADGLFVYDHPGDVAHAKIVAVHQHALGYESEGVFVAAQANAAAFEVRWLFHARTGFDEAEFVAPHAARKKWDRLQPIDVLAACDQIGRHRKLAGIVFAVMKHALVANAAFHGNDVEIEAFGLHFAVAQRL